MNTKRRASVPMIGIGNGNSHMITEMKSWSRNKLEERKLAQRHSEVDRHMASRRRVVELRQEALSREMEQNIRKTTPSLEEYLGRSQKRYHIWREREQDRLERRYRTLHRNYIKEYTQLLQDNQTLLMSQRDIFEDEDENNNKPKIKKTKRKKEKKLQDANVTSIENTPNVGDLEKTLSSIDIETNDDVDLLLLTENGRVANRNRRRASTGSIPLLSNDALSVRMSFGLPVVQEVMPIDEDDENDINNEQLESNSNGNITVVRNDGEDNINTNNDNDNDGADEVKNEPSTDDKDTNNNTPPCIKTETKNVKFGRRRSSISSLDNNLTKRRVSEVGPRGALKRGSRSPELYIGRRLDRRPTLPNAAIPVIYGN